MYDHSQDAASIRNYPPWHRVWDRVYAAFTTNDWPARLAWKVWPQGKVDIDRQTVTVAALGSGARMLRIAFAADFHAGPSTPWPVLEKGAAALAELGADLLLLGGDFVSVRAAEAERLARLLGAIPAPLGRYAVLGNHDHWAGASTVVRHLQDAGIEMLTNRSVTLPTPYEYVTVVGLDDHGSGRPDAESAFAGTAQTRIVLMHAPSSLLDIGDRHFDVALCGHTHGGQIALPNGRPVVVAHGRLSRRYNAGRYSLPNGRTLVVSRGLGCGTLPIRMNAPSAVLLCSLVASDSGGRPTSSAS